MFNTCCTCDKCLILVALPNKISEILEAKRPEQSQKEIIHALQNLMRKQTNDT